MQLPTKCSCNHLHFCFATFYIFILQQTHAFPDKQKAFHETWRVLKSGGKFIACFYIKEKSKRTDWLVKNILAKKGWFSPPFQTEKELKDILRKLYKEIDVHVDGSMVYFCCVK